MTRKDYITFSANIRAQVEKLNDIITEPYALCIGMTTLESVALQMARDFGRDNARFDRVKFLTACGFPESV